MKINITDQYNQTHTFNLVTDENNQITVRQLFEACLETAENEAVEKDSIGFEIILKCMSEFIKARIPNIHNSWTFYSERA
jgi:hypothetical protein